MKNQSASELSPKQLRRAADIKEKMEALRLELSRLLGGSENVQIKSPMKNKRKGPSSAGRARIAAAMKARWAKVRKEKKAKAREAKGS